MNYSKVNLQTKFDSWYKTICAIVPCFLTFYSLVMPNGINEHTHHWSRYWLVSSLVPSYYLNILRSRQMTAFCRWHFKVHFIDTKLLKFNYNFTEICSSGFNWQYGSIGSDKGFVLTRQQARISNDGLGCWHIHAPLALIELTIAII